MPERREEAARLQGGHDRLARRLCEHLQQLLVQNVRSLEERRERDPELDVAAAELDCFDRGEARTRIADLERQIQDVRADERIAALEKQIQEIHAKQRIDEIERRLKPIVERLKAQVVRLGS
jgi:hypothetical protein